jgi:hypothetical protein
MKYLTVRVCISKFLVDKEVMGIRKKGGRIFQLLFISLLILNCRKPPTPPDGNRQYDPRNISRTETASGGPKIGIDPFGTIHVVWEEAPEREWKWSQRRQIYYIYKTSAGEWSEPYGLTDSTKMSIDVQMGIDLFGNVHLVWEEFEWGSDSLVHNSRIYYRMRSSSGEWSDIEVISGEGAEQPRIAVDPTGTVHVVWSAGALWYTYKSPNGVWATPREIVPFAIAGDNPSLTVDDEGDCHLVYEYSGEVYYVTGFPTGEWSEPINVSQSQYTSWFGHVAVDEDGRVYVLWTEEDWGAGPQTSIIYYSVKTDTGWTVPDSIPGTRAMPRSKEFFRDGDKYILIWADGRYGEDIHYIIGNNGNWGTVNTIDTPGGSIAVDAVEDFNGGIHVVWSELEGLGSTGENWEIYYYVISF